MSSRTVRGAVAPLRMLWSPGPALDDAAVHRVVAPASLVCCLAVLGALALPRLLDVLGVVLPPTGQELLDAHLGMLRAGLRRLLLFERLVFPLPFLMGGTVLWLVAAPVLAGRGVTAGTVGGVLALGTAPLLVQRCGELAVVLAVPAAGLGAGDVAGLPARFNVGVAGVLAAAGLAAPGWLGVAAEAASGVGAWVVVLWVWGLARLDRDATRSPHDGHALWWSVAAVSAYAAGWVLYAALYPTLLLLVMGAP
jgi:hypothetical protein